LNTQITITLSETVYRRAERLAELTGQQVEDIIANQLNISLPPLGSEMDHQPVETLSDAEILALSESMMDENLNSRMSMLLQKQQASEINDAEQAELKMLMEVFEVGQLRKAQALVESIKRGLREPLVP
jgi:hypothetical protein